MRDPSHFLRRLGSVQPLGVGVALLLLGAAVVAVIALWGSGGSSESPAPSPLVSRPGGPGQPTPEPIGHAKLAHTERAARAFAGGYLDALYGRGEASAIHRATAELRRRIDRRLVRVPPTRDALRPRVVALRLTARGDGSVTATCLVDDDDAPRYPLGFVVSERGDRWAVTGVLND